MSLSYEALLALRQRYAAISLSGDPDIAGAWGKKGRAMFRYEILASMVPAAGLSVVDLGCGIGASAEFFLGIGAKSWTGIEVQDSLVREGNGLLGGENAARIVHLDAFSDFELDGEIAVGSGLFNWDYEGSGNLNALEGVLRRLKENGFRAVAFNFLDSRCDIRYSGHYYAEPEAILNLASRYSRRLAIRMDYLPFEFSVAVFFDEAVALELSRYEVEW